MKNTNKAEKAVSQKQDNTLEIKFNNVTCQIVGEGKICSLADVVAEKDARRAILTIPEYIFTDFKEVAQKYLKSHGLDVLTSLNTDFIKNILLPYKGIKGEVAGREFMIWKENGLIILTVATK